MSGKAKEPREDVRESVSCVLGRVWCVWVCVGGVWVCVGACVGVCGVCVGCVWGVCGACVGGCLGWCCWGRGREKVSLAPLYYPDTLVNPDTCLGHSFTNFCVKVLLELYESENENFLMSLKHCALEDMTMYDAVASLLVVRGVVIKGLYDFFHCLLEAC